MKIISCILPSLLVSTVCSARQTHWSALIRILTTTTASALLIIDGHAQFTQSQDDSLTKIYDQRDLSTITDEPNLGAKPVQVIKTEDGLSKVYDRRDLSSITDEPNLGAKPVHVIKAEGGVSKVYDQQDLSPITDEPDLGAKPSSVLVGEFGQPKDNLGISPSPVDR